MTKNTDKVSFQGGPRDGQIGTIKSVSEPVFVDDDGSTYVRQASQIGDARIYRFTLGDGEAHPVSFVGSVDAEPTLARDIADLAKGRKSSK